MFACLIGAILAQRWLSRTHDRQLATIQPSTEGEACELDATDVSREREVGGVEFTTEGRALVEQVVEVGAGDEGGHLGLGDDEGAGFALDWGSIVTLDGAAQGTGSDRPRC